MLDDFVVDNRCNKIATNYEKYIDANKTTAKKLNTSVKKNYRDDSQGSQAIDFSTIVYIIYSP